MDHGSGTHSARLDGHINLAVLEPMIAEGQPSRTQGDDLGMSGRIVVAQIPVLSCADQLPASHYDRSDWDLSAPLGGSCFVECSSHPVFVVGHGDWQKAIGYWQ
jgi:hypothetical protein